MRKGVDSMQKDFFMSIGKCVSEIFDIMDCGQRKCTPDHSTGPYIRDYCLLHYIEDGEGLFVINNTVHKVEKGSAFYIPPHVMTYYESDKKNPWVYKWVGIKGEGMEKYFAYAGLSVETPVKKLGRKVSESMDNVINCLKEEKDGLMLTSCIYAFLSALSENSQQKEISKSLQYVEKCEDYLERCPYKKITVTELSEYVNIDRSYLTAIFKKHRGISPQRYIMENKLRKACDFLKNTDYDVTYISQSVGYDDPFVFSHAFKKLIGMSPTEYRRKNI